MDQNDLRVVMTVLGFVTFLGIVWWAWGKGRQAGFDEAALLPFTEDEEPNRAGRVSGGAD